VLLALFKLKNQFFKSGALHQSRIRFQIQGPADDRCKAGDGFLVASGHLAKLFNTFFKRQRFIVHRRWRTMPERSPSSVISAYSMQSPHYFVSANHYFHMFALR
jgi:hypothetical protein